MRELTRVAKIARVLFARPADVTQYAVGDLVANVTVAGNVVPLELEVAATAGGAGLTSRLRLKKSTVSLVAASFRVHLFRLRPTVTGGDNAAFGANGFAAGFIGSADVTVDVAHTDGASGAANLAFRFDAGPGSKKIYALIEARGTYTPGSAEQFGLALEVQPD